MSLVISAPGFQMTCTIPASFSSLKKNCFTSICLVLPPTVQLLQRSFAPLLSTYNTIGNLTFSSIEFNNLMTYIMSWTHKIAAKSSASITIGIIQLLKLIGDPFKKVDHPFTLLLLSSFAYSESLFPTISNWYSFDPSQSLLSLITSPSFAVSTQYFMTLNIAAICPSVASCMNLEVSLTTFIMS